MNDNYVYLIKRDEFNRLKPSEFEQFKCSKQKLIIRLSSAEFSYTDKDIGSMLRTLKSTGISEVYRLDPTVTSLDKTYLVYTPVMIAAEIKDRNAMYDAINEWIYDDSDQGLDADV